MGCFGYHCDPQDTQEKSPAAIPHASDSPIMNGARKDKLCDLVNLVNGDSRGHTTPMFEIPKDRGSSYGKLTIFRGAMSLGIPENPTDVELEQILGIYQVGLYRFEPVHGVKLTHTHGIING